jgi:hypothetical protein
MTYKTQFPDFDSEVPEFVGFKDTSWHNDVCPSFYLDLGDGKGLRVWVDYADKTRREYSAPDSKRFVLDLMEEDEYIKMIIQTDNLEVLYNTINDYRANITR